MEIVKQQNRKKHEKANMLYIGLQQLVRNAGKTWLTMGEYLYNLKKGSLYRYVYGRDVTWAEFLGECSLGIKSSTARNMMGCYRYFIVECGYDEEMIATIGVSKAQHMLHRCKSHPEEREELLESARVLTAGGIIDTIREREGRDPMKPKAESFSKGDCLLCGGEAERAHFPLTKRAGGEFTIPLCREHHSEYHTIGVDTWFAQHKRPLEKYLRTLWSEGGYNEGHDAGDLNEKG